MIEKPTILITSIGRTGTEFFSKFFADIVPESTSLHEPDVVQYVGIENKLQSFVGQVRRAGVWRMVILKSLGQWNLAQLSDARLKGKMRNPEVVKRLEYQRRGFIARIPGKIYIESNFGYYGLIDLLPDVFANHRVIYLIRDGRDWIRSAVNWGEAYGKTGLRKFIGHQWPSAQDFAGDPLAENWDNLPRFDRLCWAWARLNDFALQAVAKNPYAQLFRFEDVFTGKDKYDYLDRLVNFATILPGIETSHLGSTQGWLERKIHPSIDGFPAWESWSKNDKQRFETICGPLMEKAGYKF